MSCPKAKYKDGLAAMVVDGDPELEQHLAGCADCRREAESLKKTLRALQPLAGATPAADDVFVAAVRRGFDERAVLRQRRWRLPAVSAGLAAAAALVALLGARVLHPPVHHTPLDIRGAHSDDAEYFDDGDPAELIGDLDHEDVAKVQAHYRKGA